MCKYLLAGLAALGAVGCNYHEQVVAPSEVILALRIDPKTLLADGSSTATLEAELPISTIDTKRSVTFTTSQGTFLPDGKTTVSTTAQSIAGQDGQVRLIATTVLKGVVETGKLVITTQVQNVARIDTLVLTKAFPETIRLTADKLYYKPTAGTEVILTVELKRQIGLPSSGQAFMLIVTDSINRPIGNFRNRQLTTGADAKAINYFSVSPNAFKGTLKAVATTLTANGHALTDTVTFFVLKP